ncbi:MAG TPA: hypothetical protein PK156_48250, partial [Polyangium sp.]|nr:hypothetical protein [Polyangium sp.]
AAKTVPSDGTVLVFDSYNRMVKSTCSVETRVHQIKEGPWTWQGFLRLTAEPQCKFVHGQSGTAGVDVSSHVIYALAQTMYEGGKACSFNNPCEISPNGHKTVGKHGQPYAVPVAALYDCFDLETKRFDFHRGTCSLGNAQPMGLSTGGDSRGNAVSQ